MTDLAATPEGPIQVHLPARTPRTGGRFSRWFGQTLMRLGGWRIVGAFPDLDKIVLIAAPHSSGWDAVWGLIAKLGMGLRIEFMAKAELFWGPLGWLLRWLGGIPTHRQDPRGLVGTMTARFAQCDQLWLTIAPEGTRRPAVRWRTGFWRIAHAAGVPVHCAAFDYPNKRIVIGPTVPLSDDMDADLARIAAIYSEWQGKHRRINPVR